MITGEPKQQNRRPARRRIVVFLALVIVIPLLCFLGWKWRLNHFSSEFTQKASRATDSISRAAERMYDGTLLFAPAELEAERDIQGAQGVARTKKERDLAESMSIELFSIGVSNQQHWTNRAVDRQADALKDLPDLDAITGVSSRELEEAKTRGICIGSLREELSGVDNGPESHDCFERTKKDVDQDLEDFKRTTEDLNRKVEALSEIGRKKK